MKAILFGLLSFVVLACGSNSHQSPRAAATKRAYKLLHNSRFAEAYTLLDSVVTAYPERADTAYYLRNDISQVIDSNALNNLALIIDRNKRWGGIDSGTYKPSEFWLKSSMTWAKEPLLITRARLPRLKKEAAKRDAASIKAQANRSKQLAFAEAREPVEKRIKAGQGLREIYLDSGQDVKVTVTGKNKDIITLSFVLIGDVWSHRMNKEGNIDALLDLGFKKVILTDGYDYRMVWSRKN